MDEWIKYRVGLHQELKVIAMAQRLESSYPELKLPLRTHLAVSGLMRIWSWAQTRIDVVTESLACHDPVTLDTIAEVDGLAAAMVEVGYIVADAEKRLIYLPNFCEYNVPQSVRKTAKATVRKRRQRELSRLSHAECHTKKEKENKKENKNKNKARAYTTEFEQFWSSFPKRGRSRKTAAFKAWISAISQADPQQIIKAAAEYADSDKGQSEYAGHASTWLNGGCWEDARDSWKRKASNGSASDFTKRLFDGD